MQISNHASNERVQSCWQVLLQQTARTPQVSHLLQRGYHALVARTQCIYDHLRRQPRHIRRRLQRQLGASLAGAALALALAHSPAQAASITVDGTTCTLVDALIAANSDTATGGCTAGSGADIITLTTDVTLTTVNNTDIGPNGLPLITSVITIEGAGHTISRMADAPDFRPLQVAASGTLTLNQGIVSGGSLPNNTHGGGILNQGTLTVSNSVLSGNMAIGGGGAVVNAGSMTVINSTLSDNAAISGGGIFNTGTLIVSNSTFSGNTAVLGLGGGIYSTGTLTVSNSTFSGNIAEIGGGISNTGMATVSNSTLSGNTTFNGSGAGIFNSGIATVNNSTLSGNTAPLNTGGGIFNYNGTLTLARSLIAGNTAPIGAEIHNIGGVVNSNNFNLFGHSGETTAEAFSGFTPSGSDITTTSDATTPTALASILNTTLQVNGSGTPTHALVAGSPAIDAAGDGPFATDQRGVSRPQGTADDIGAFEAKSLNGSVTPDTPSTANNPTPQLCDATGTNLAIYTITLPQQNTSATTFADLFYRVKVLEYTVNQGGQQPSLCNATTVVNNGGVGSTLAVPNSSLPGGDNKFDPVETFTQVFSIGRPVQAQFRIKVDLFSSSAAAANAAGSAGEEYLGSFEYTSTAPQIFLPLVSR